MNPGNSLVSILSLDTMEQLKLPTLINESSERLLHRIRKEPLFIYLVQFVLKTLRTENERYRVS